jgi:2-keto-4-pentenoate hydratase/2-oxohepta-3-ene-1,7-dioic acid hydratase in catechol pathway
VKLASISHGGVDRVVAAIGDHQLIDVAEVLAIAGETNEAPADMLAILQGGEVLLKKISAALNRLEESPGQQTLIDPSEVRWYPPVRNPGKICGVAMNNSSSNARKISAPDHPAFFLKPASCLIGHKEAISIRKYYGSVHPEPELAVIIGRSMRDVPAREALEYVAGYSVMNDITGNGMRAEDMFQYWAIYAKEDNADETHRVEQHLSYAGRYKGCDTFGVLGPWIVTKDEIANPDNLAVECRVGNDVVADDSTCYYNYKVAEVLSFISQFHTLYPGDVVSCGTAFKPSANRKSIHNANFQQVPGPVSVTIEGLGYQENTVVVEDREIGKWRLS